MVQNYDYRILIKRLQIVLNPRTLITEQILGFLSFLARLPWALNPWAWKLQAWNPLPWDPCFVNLRMACLIKTSSYYGLCRAMSCFLPHYLSPVNYSLLGARLSKLSSRSKTYLICSLTCMDDFGALRATFIPIDSLSNLPGPILGTCWLQQTSLSVCEC